MYGKCKDCKKMMSCWLPCGVKYGFCETSFEPKEPIGQKDPSSSPAGMTWRQLPSAVWEAEGKCGKFRIERRGGKFWACYASEDISINFRPKNKLSEAKEFCERSPYWEDAI